MAAQWKVGDGKEGIDDDWGRSKWKSAGSNGSGESNCSDAAEHPHWATAERSNPIELD